MLKRELILARVVAKAFDLVIAFAILKAFDEVGLIGGLLYLTTCDGFFDGRSFGKHLLRLRVRCNSTEIGPLFASILRNLNIGLAFVLTFVPYVGGVLFGALLIIDLVILIGNQGRRIGDIVANTTVIREERNVS